MLAAETIGGTNKLNWRNNPTGQMHVWALNSSWGWTGGDAGLIDANSSEGANFFIIVYCLQYIIFSMSKKQYVPTD